MSEAKIIGAEKAVRELTLARRILEKYQIADWESLKGTEDWSAWLEDT